MFLLIGEQPAPNLLPVRHFKPERVILVHTDFTEHIAFKLKKLIESPIETILQPVNAYDLVRIYASLKVLCQPWADTPVDLLFNLTGGTKPMALAAYETARGLGSSLCYFQTQGSQSLLHLYRFNAGQVEPLRPLVLPGIIDLHDYISAHVDNYTVGGFAKSEGGMFEEAVFEALTTSVDEIKAGVKLGGAIDVDMIVRIGNQVGIIEVKGGKKARTKDGIDQLNTAGGRSFLGTYTAKFLVVDRVWGHTLTNLQELAKARNVQVIELESFGRAGALSDADIDQLRSSISRSLRK